MQKAIILVLLATISVALGEFCCSQDDKPKANKVKASARPVPTTQVLNLKALLKKDETLINERTYGTNLDWTFKCISGGVVENVLAHKSLVLKYSPALNYLCKIMARGAQQKNEHEVFFSAAVIRSLMDLLYEHKVTIQKADYGKVIAAAKLFEFDKLIETEPVAAPVVTPGKGAPVAAPIDIPGKGAPANRK